MPFSESVEETFGEWAFNHNTAMNTWGRFNPFLQTSRLFDNMAACSIDNGVMAACLAGSCSTYGASLGFFAGGLLPFVVVERYYTASMEKDAGQEGVQEPVYNILETTCTIILAHPKYVKAIRGKKTDKRDAKWIADIFKHDLVSGSFTPPADIRQLRDLMRYHWKLTNFTTGEKNRAQNCLTVSNIKLDDVFSDVFDRAAAAITTRLLESSKPFDVTPYLTRGIKAPVEKIQAAVDGEMCAQQAEKLRIIRSHMDALELCKLNLQSLILTTAEKYLPQINIVATAPGIQAFSAIAIISEIGVDMSVFPTSKHLCSWAGLTPQNNERAGKRKTTRISLAGPISSPCLFSALCAPSERNSFPKSAAVTSH